MKGSKFTKIDNLFCEAYQAIHQITATLKERPDNQTPENRLQLSEADERTKAQLETLKSFDR